MEVGVEYIGVTVSFLCHDGQGRVLLNKRSRHCRDEHGHWDGGGGRVEFGETLQQALRREIREEYSAEIMTQTFLGYRDVFRQQAGQATHWLSLDYLVQLDPNQVKNNEPDKFDALEWFAWQELPSPMHSQFPQFVRQYGQQLEAVLGAASPLPPERPVSSG